MTEVDFNELQKQFPSPCASYDKLSRDNYCVGGALCLYLWAGQARVRRFPNVGRVMNALREANPELSKAAANHYADKILRYNDRDKIQEAWGALKDALDFTERKL